VSDEAGWDGDKGMATGSAQAGCWRGNIRIGSDYRDKFERLARHYFDADSVMFPLAFDDYNKLLTEGKKIDPSFRFYQDAIDFILEQRERKYREQLIAKYTDEKLDMLLTTTLYPYQKEGIRFAFERGRSIILR